MFHQFPLQGAADKTGEQVCLPGRETAVISSNVPHQQTQEKRGAEQFYLAWVAAQFFPDGRTLLRQITAEELGYLFFSEGFHPHLAHRGGRTAEAGAVIQAAAAKDQGITVAPGALPKRLPPANALPVIFLVPVGHFI